MLDIFDRVPANSAESPLVHIEDCPYLPIALIVVNVIANNREEREYLGIWRWRLIVGQAADDSSGFTGDCLQCESGVNDVQRNRGRYGVGWNPLFRLAEQRYGPIGVAPFLGVAVFVGHRYSNYVHLGHVKYKRVLPRFELFEIELSFLSADIQFLPKQTQLFLT
jgi:hypothetical protein